MAGPHAGVERRVLLLVEDNADDEYLTCRALRRDAVPTEVIVVRDGAEALDWLFIRGVHADRDRNIHPQVVLLDLNLPKIGGLDVLRTLRGEPATRRLPVVVLTSSDDDRDLVDSYNLGVNGYVRKPVELVEFYEVVRKIGLFWLGTNETPSPR